MSLELSPEEQAHGDEVRTALQDACQVCLTRTWPGTRDVRTLWTCVLCGIRTCARCTHLKFCNYDGAGDTMAAHCPSCSKREPAP